MGDFNDILCEAEKFGGNKPCSKLMALFRKNIDSCNLIDLGFFGPRFTLLNLRQPKHRIMERLDRYLANPQWLNMYHNATVQHLT